MTDTKALVECPSCGPTTWHRSRGSDCMHAVCDRCGFGYDIGWAPTRPDYFPEEGTARASEVSE